MTSPAAIERGRQAGFSDFVAKFDRQSGVRGQRAPDAFLKGVEVRLASEGVEQLSPLKFYWWLLVFPCTLLAVTLLSLNFLGDGLRDVFDPKKEAAKI